MTKRITLAGARQIIRLLLQESDLQGRASLLTFLRTNHLMHMMRIILIPLMLCGACTIYTSTDIERLGRIERALDTKADSATTAQNFQFMAQELNKLREAQKAPAQP